MIGNALGRRRWRCSFLGLLALLSVPGCSGSDPLLSATWVKEKVTEGINSVHDFTGWLLNKDDVSVETVETTQSNDCFFAKVKITVTHGDNTFSTITQNVEYDADGIPTEEGTKRIQEAVERIKQQVIKKLQK
jgi:hypothetical protein